MRRRLILFLVALSLAPAARAFFVSLSPSPSALWSLPCGPTPSPSPNPSLFLILVLQSPTVNATLLASVLRDRGIVGTIVNTTALAGGQYSQVQLLPQYPDTADGSSAFLDTACTLAQLTAVQNAVVRRGAIVSVTVQTTAGDPVPILGLCPEEPLPSFLNGTVYSPTVDPAPYAAIVVGTLCGVWGFAFVAVMILLVYQHRQEQQQLEAPLDLPSPSFASRPTPLPSTKGSVWERQGSELPGAMCSTSARSPRGP